MEKWRAISYFKYGDDILCVVEVFYPYFPFKWFPFGKKIYKILLTINFIITIKWLPDFESYQEAIDYLKSLKNPPVGEEIKNFGEVVLYCAKPDCYGNVWCSLENNDEFTTPILAKDVPIGAYLMPSAARFFLFYLGRDSVDTDDKLIRNK